MENDRIQYLQIALSLNPGGWRVDELVAAAKMIEAYVSTPVAYTKTAYETALDERVDA